MKSVAFVTSLIALAALSAMPVSAQKLGAHPAIVAARVDAKAVTHPMLAGTDGPPAQRHAEAVQAFRSQRYAVAYGAFARLADEGHAPSAALALLMVSQGEWLLGREWSATPGQLLRWNALAQHDLYEQAVALTDHDRGE